jgi:hypothetical protein
VDDSADKDLAFDIAKTPPAGAAHEGEPDDQRPKTADEHRQRDHDLADGTQAARDPGG